MTSVMFPMNPLEFNVVGSMMHNSKLPNTRPTASCLQHCIITIFISCIRINTEPCINPCSYRCSGVNDTRASIPARLTTFSMIILLLLSDIFQTSRQQFSPSSSLFPLMECSQSIQAFHGPSAKLSRDMVTHHPHRKQTGILCMHCLR